MNQGKGLLMMEGSMVLVRKFVSMKYNSMIVRKSRLWVMMMGLIM